MNRPKSPLQVIAEHLAAATKVSVAQAVPEAEALMDKLARCRLPDTENYFRLNNPEAVATRVTAACNIMERMGLDPLFVHDVRRLAASVKAVDPEGHKPLINAMLARAQSQAYCEAEDPPEAVWCRNDELRRALEDAEQVYIEAARKDYENERRKQV